MAITISVWKTRRQRSAASAWGMMAATLILPQRAGAADLAFVPTLRLSESYSDNIRLAPPQLAMSELVSEFAPGITVTSNTARLKMNLAYSIQKLVYQKDPDTLNHQLQGNAKSVLLDDWLFADANASIRKQNVSAFGPQLIDNTQLSGNQSTVKGLSFSPYLLHDVRGLATAELRYTYQDVRSGGSAGLSARSDDLRFKLTGDKAGKGLIWDLYVDRNKIDDSFLAPVTATSGALTLRYPLASSLSVFGTAGYERNDYATSDASQPAGRLWSIGAAWNPSRRTSFSASGGKRFFGNTYSLDASHRSHNTVWNLTYSEDITTTYAQFLALTPNDTSALLNQLWLFSIPDPVARQQAINLFIQIAPFFGVNAGAINYLSHQYFLDKRLNLSMALSGPRTTLVLNLAHLQHTAQSTSSLDNSLLGAAQQALEDRSRQSSASAGWSWRLSGRSSLNLSASYDRVNSLVTQRRDQNAQFVAGLTQQLQARVNATVQLHHVNHSSNAGGSYRENGINAALNFQF